MTEDAAPAKQRESRKPRESKDAPESRLPEIIPVIPSGSNIVYPQQLMPVLAAAERDVKAIDVAASSPEKLLAIFSQAPPPEGAEPAPSDGGSFREIGTA